ncbi:MAG: TadE family protein [Chloroflexota bacterium]
MQANHPENRNLTRRKGQTLVEFAITLPVLLVLMFGIVEFGRIFQSWVSIQNAARESARYASTNQFEARYNDVINLDRVDDPQSIIPCVSDSDRAGLIESFPAVAGRTDNRVSIFNGNGSGWNVWNSERLFATWYQGRDCDPTNETDQNLRRDLLRLASIYETAYWASIGRSDFPALTVIPIGIQNIGASDPSDTGANDEETRANRARRAETALINFIYSNFNEDYPQYRPDNAVLADHDVHETPHGRFVLRIGTHKVRKYRVIRTILRIVLVKV